MPKYEGVYQDAKGGWYFKVWVGRDPLSGKQTQLTKRGFRSAADAARARRKAMDDAESLPKGRTLPMALTVDELLDQYLDGLDADRKLSAKTRFDYRHNAQVYVRPWLGKKKVRDVTPEVVLAWQRKLLAEGGSKNGKALSPNTVRLARAPLAGAMKIAVAAGIVRTNPVGEVPKPPIAKSVPKHWSPDQARAFLGHQDGDRLYVLWAFLLLSGLRIGELVWLRWDNIDLKKGYARIHEFVSTLGWDLVASDGKSRTATRTIDLDAALVQLLERQREMQKFESRREGYVESPFVFTKPAGDSYHPQVLSRMLARESVEAGLPRLTAHGLRHTCATLMLDSGVPPKVAAERLGHSDATLFLNLYSHVTPTMQREAADKLGAALLGDG